MDYAGNSKKSKEEKTSTDKKIEKVINTEVIQKPKGPGRKFKDVFFGGDARHAASFVTTDVLLPALRNLIVDMVTNGMERLIYGDSRGRRGGPVNYGSRYHYQSGNSHPFRPDPRDRRPFTSPAPRQSRNRHEMNDIVIGTKEEAQLVMERLNDIIDHYEVVSLADFYELIGVPSQHIDNKWGWTFLGNASIRQIRQGYLLELPPLEEL